jgi:hypothetical protein
VRNIYCYIHLAFVLLPFCLQAQLLRTIHYTVDEGLPSNELYDVHEDAQGYIWMASDQGVIRFDGVEFDSYTTQDGLATNTIFSVEPDHRGWLWMRGIDGSLTMYDGNAFRPFPDNAQLRECLEGRFIDDFYWAQDGSLYFSSSGSPQELFTWNPETRMAYALHLPPGDNLAILYDAGRPVFAHFQEEEGQPSTTALLPACFATTRIHVAPDLAPAVYALALQDSSAVIGVSQSILHWKNGRVVRQLDHIAGRKGLARDHAGNVMISAKAGIWKWRPGDAAPTLFLPTGILCTQAIQDRNGNYFVATHDGMQIVPRLMLQSFPEEAADASDAVRALQASPYGIICLLSHPARLALLPYGRDGTPKGPLTLLHRFQFASFNDFGLGQGGRVLYGFGPIRTKVKSVDNKVISLVGVYDLGAIQDIQAMGNTVLFARREGWTRADSTGQVCFNSAEAGFDTWCTAIGQDSNGRTWIGTRDQLMYADGSLTLPFRPGDGLFRCRITAIQVGPHGVVAVSTRGNGVILIKDGRYLQFTRRHGLPSDHCGNLWWGRSGLWIATNQGLALLHRDLAYGRPNVQVVSNKMGLASQMVHDVMEVQGHVFVATGKGLNWFLARALDAPQQVQPVRISSVRVDGRELEHGTKVAWNARQITFEYGAARLLAAPSPKYHYRLHGYDPAWRTTDAGSASYFELPHGNYTFEVGSCMTDGRWDIVTASVAVEIAPHFSELGWVRWLAACAVLLLLIGLAYWRVRAIRRSQAQAIQLQLAEIKALRAQMKPHFMYNALNAIQHYILQGDRQAGAHYLSLFAALSRRVMAQSDRSSITVAEELETLRLYIELERMRFDLAFTFDIQVADAALLEAEIPPMLIQPFVENAILHGLLHQSVAPVLTISLRTVGKGLEWRIIDNGPGRTAAAQRASGTSVHASSAMSNIAERIALLNGLGLFKIIFKTEDRQPTGTQVVVSFYWDQYCRNDELSRD